jgi:hypothetical protein
MNPHDRRILPVGLFGIAVGTLALRKVNDPHQSYFVALVPLSSLLAAAALIPFARGLAIAVFAASALFQLGWGVVAHGRFWLGTDKPTSKTPAMYLSAIARNPALARPKHPARGLSEHGDKHHDCAQSCPSCPAVMPIPPHTTTRMRWNASSCGACSYANARLAPQAGSTSTR